MEKYTSAPLLPHSSPVRQRSHRGSIALLISLFALVAVLAPSRGTTLTSLFFSNTSPDVFDSTANPSCDQAEPILPSADVHDISSVRSQKDRIIAWHQGAIRIPTQVYDQMGEPGVDPHWDIFGKLHEYLEQSYPLVHKNLKRTKVDTYGLIYEWFGSDLDLQPIMLTGHQDVVPVLPDTISQWKEAPFNGTYDGTYIWGRGSNDDKSTLTSVLASIELMLEKTDFQPRRTVVLGFGHDEERGGQRGAPHIRDWILEHYGPDSMAIVIDEGTGIQQSWGRTFAVPAVGEKGKFNLNLTLSTLGGHSSVPPPHTNIGFVSLLVAALEANPHPIKLEKNSPILGFLQCAAAHAPDMPKDLKRAVLKSGKSHKALKDLPREIIKTGLGDHFASEGMGDMATAVMTTTQAIDIINGGLKVNALPELVTVIVNHRIDIASSPSEVMQHVFNTLLPVVKEHSLSMSGFDQSFEPESRPKGHVALSSAFEAPHGPAPISPTDLGNAAWRTLAGTARGVWASRPEVSGDGRMAQLAEDEELIMSPYMSTGNTDTRSYHDLTRNIYRWRYFLDDENQGAHTINERVRADAMVEYVRYYQALILNFDASTDL